MRSAAALRWMVGAVLLSIVIAALAYFTIISPALDATEEARERAESEQSRIDQLEIQLVGLKADFERIDEFKAELAALEVQLPPEVLLNELTRQVDGHALQAGVGIVGVSTSTPYQVLPPMRPAQPVEPTTPDDADPDGDSDESDSSAPPPPPEPAGPVLPEGFFAVPVQLTTVGTYADTLDFIDRLQQQNDRLLFVSAVQAGVLDQGGAEGGRPATEAGDLETQISFIGYVLLDPDSAFEIPEGDDGEPSPEPLPSDNGNPFAPLN